jgi:hypothetical protein
VAEPFNDILDDILIVLFPLLFFTFKVAVAIDLAGYTFGVKYIDSRVPAVEAENPEGILGIDEEGRAFIVDAMGDIYPGEKTGQDSLGEGQIDLLAPAEVAVEDIFAVVGQFHQFAKLGAAEFMYDIKLQSFHSLPPGCDSDIYSKSILSGQFVNADGL